MEEYRSWIQSIAFLMHSRLCEPSFQLAEVGVVGRASENVVFRLKTRRFAEANTMVCRTHRWPRSQETGRMPLMVYKL